jgi:Domain of unknown function (DUF4258)
MATLPVPRSTASSPTVSARFEKTSVSDPHDATLVLQWVRAQASIENIRVTQHAQEEMAEEGILLDDVLEAITAGEILENYPDHKRGPCCLVNGITSSARALHIICTSGGQRLIIITAYEPMPPKWITSRQRRFEGGVQR